MRIRPTIARPGLTLGDVAPARRINVEHLLERLHAAVVHVGPRHRHVAQARRTKATHVHGIEGELVDPPIVGRVAAHPIDIVEAGVLKRVLREGRVDVAGGQREIEAAVTMVAFERLGEEELGPARGRLADRVRVPPLVAVVGRVARDQDPDEARERVDDVLEADRLARARKRSLEQAEVLGIFGEAGQHFVLVTGDAELDRKLAEHRDQDLLFELVEVGVGPGQLRAIGRVGQPERVASQELAGRAERRDLAVGEGELLQVTGRAGHRLIGRERVGVKEMPAELDLGCRQRVVLGDHRLREVLGQLERRLALVALARLALRRFVGLARLVGAGRRAEREHEQQRRAGRIIRHGRPVGPSNRSCTRRS